MLRCKPRLDENLCAEHPEPAETVDVKGQEEVFSPEEKVALRFGRL